MRGDLRLFVAGCLIRVNLLLTAPLCLLRCRMPFHHRFLAVGMGFRVPFFAVSPWSRGGFVVSEVFDHTSVIKASAAFRLSA